MPLFFAYCTANFKELLKVCRKALATARLCIALHRSLCFHLNYVKSLERDFHFSPKAFSAFGGYAK